MSAILAACEMEHAAPFWRIRLPLLPKSFNITFAVGGVQPLVAAGVV
jgi:hypothetical protein